MSKLSEKLTLLLSKFTQPQSKHYKSQIERDVASTRYKISAVLHILGTLIFILDILLGNSSVSDGLFRAALTLSVIVIQLLACKYHPRIFDMYINLLFGSYGIAIICFSNQGIYSAWGMAVVMPMFGYIFTGSLFYYILQTSIHMLYLNIFYMAPMEEAVRNEDPRVFTQNLKAEFQLLACYNILTVWQTYYLLKLAHRRINITEKKNVEMENQKVFLLSFSHELRNLLNSLVGNVQLVGLEENLSNQTKDLIKYAEVCGELLIHLVNNILDTGKIEIGELEVNPTPTKVIPTLEKLWGVCSELIRQKNLEGTLRVQNDIPRMISIDNYRITQILLNLISNAVKYTERGSISVTIEWINCKEVNRNCFLPYPFSEEDEFDEGVFEKSQMLNSVSDTFSTMTMTKKKIYEQDLVDPISKDQGVLKITVHDTGCGISIKDRALLFQKFSQFNADASRRQLGTGLGLFITKQICDKMNAEIQVFSRIGHGSCFSICMPVTVVTVQNENLRDPKTLAAILKRKKLTAMIVDDTKFNHLILSKFFQKLNIEVINVAYNGAEAYEKFCRQSILNRRPDIVTMDLDMPIMNGKDSSQKIREFEAANNLSPCFLAIVSGNCMESEINECLNKDGAIKADSFLKKPTKMEELANQLYQHFIER